MGEQRSNSANPDDLISVALQALSDVAADPEAPANARVQAASAILNHAGDGGHVRGPIKPVGDLSLAEIDAELARITGQS